MWLQYFTNVSFAAVRQRTTNHIALLPLLVIFLFYQIHIKFNTYNFLLVFYSVTWSRWNRCCVVSRYSQSRNVIPNKRRTKNIVSYLPNTFATQHGQWSWPMKSSRCIKEVYLDHLWLMPACKLTWSNWLITQSYQTIRWYLTKQHFAE